MARFYFFWPAAEVVTSRLPLQSLLSPLFASPFDLSPSDLLESELFIRSKMCVQEAKIFSKVVESGALVHLTTLGLGDNEGMGSEGMKAFASAIACGSLAKLENLYLYDNKIGDEGMKAFSAAIASGPLPALQHVGLDGNPGSDAPVMKALAERKR